MKKFITRQGYIAYACTALETTYLGGFGVCDDCGEDSGIGYLVPVLNHYMCPACFEEWQARACFYPEDSPFEEKNARYYEHRIPMDTEAEEKQEEEKWQ